MLRSSFPGATSGRVLAPEDVTVVIPIGRDGNRDWLDQAIRSFPEGTKYLVLENDGELAEAKNEGAKAAETPFVQFFDADDVALPDFLENLRSMAWNADVVYPTMILTSEDLTEPLGTHLAFPFCGNRLLDFNFVSGSSLVRREKFLEVGGFDPSFPVWEDWDLWVRMYRAGAHFKPCTQAKMIYRQHSYSRSQTEIDPEQIRKRIIGEPDPALEYKATFYTQATPATTYVRCQLPSRYLPGKVLQQLVWAGGHYPQQRGDAAILQFPGDKATALHGLMMKQEGLRCLVEVDDNYLIHPGKRVLDRSGWSMEVGGKESSRNGHRWIAEHADGVIVTTPWLADRYRKVNPNVYVCPNGVDPPDWPEPEKPDDGILRILWSAGPSHDIDIPLAARAMEWASRQKDVEVYVAGLETGWDFAKTYPWLGELDLYRKLPQGFDIGIAPVRQTAHGMGRSDLKALEYAMGTVCPVMSDLAPYDAWKDGENCLKAKDAKGFYKAIRRLVENRDEVKQLADAARSYVLKERTAQVQRSYWLEAIEDGKTRSGSIGSSRSPVKRTLQAA